jgi:hypothetical protein
VLTVAAIDPAPGVPEPRHMAPPAPAPSKPAPPGPANAVPDAPVPAQVPVTPVAEQAAEPSGRFTRVAPRPAPAKPAALADASAPEPDTERSTGARMPGPVPKPMPKGAEIDIADGVVGIDAGRSRPRVGGALGSVAFEPESAMLTPHAMYRLRQLLAEAAAREARIQVVGEAAAPALALDRALAVGLALVQSGIPADRLELTLARGGSSDQAQLFLAAPAL